jgi:hypothetical protein
MSPQGALQWGSPLLRAAASRDAKGGRSLADADYNRPMPRRFVAFMAMVALLWQSVAMAPAGFLPGILADVQHVVLHWQDEGHHHHADGSWHVDESTESVQHAAADHVGSAPALHSTVTLHWAHMASQSPPAAGSSAISAPFLESPLRPPRSTA